MQSVADQSLPSPDIASLSVAELRMLLREKDRLIADHAHRLKEQDHLLKAKEQRIQLLEAELRLARQRREQREAAVPGQLLR